MRVVGVLMSKPSLSVYGRDCETEPNQQLTSNTVRVTAGETLALLMHASRTNRAWLNDFADETILVSQDMYEVLVAYKRISLEEKSQSPKRVAA